MKRTLRVAIFGICLLLSSTAQAHRQELDDPRDNPGPLDIAVVKNADRRLYVTQTHPSKTWPVRELRFKITTYESWQASLLEGEFNFIAIEVVRRGHDGGLRGDVCFYIEPRGDRYLRGRMYRTCWPSPADPKGEWRNVLRPDEYSAKAVFNRKLLGENVRAYRWRFATSFEEEEHPDCSPAESMPPEKVYGTCADFSEWREHRM